MQNINLTEGILLYYTLKYSQTYTKIIVHDPHKQVTQNGWYKVTLSTNCLKLEF